MNKLIFDMQHSQIKKRLVHSNMNDIEFKMIIFLHKQTFFIFIENKDKSIHK